HHVRTRLGDRQRHGSPQSAGRAGYQSDATRQVKNLQGHSKKPSTPQSVIQRKKGTAASLLGFCRPVHGPLPPPCRPAVNGGSPGTRGGVGPIITGLLEARSRAFA